MPLWNPYQLCGAPIAANSQSAPFYPGNLLFYLLPTARAFGYSAVVHLTLAGWFTYLLLRRLRCTEAAALFGGTAFAFSAWQVGWLQLPSFLATSCWIPLILRQAQILVCGSSTSRRHVAPATVVLSGSIGMMLLAGHLQIAFYGLMAAILWTLTLLTVNWKRNGASATARVTLVCVVSLALGGMLSADQTLPSFELSRVSHRVSKPTAQGYTLYADYALPKSALIQIGLPDFFGGDWDPDNKYWGFYTQRVGDQDVAIRHNAAETSIYVGISTFVLGLYAIFGCFFAGQTGRDRRPLFFAGLALLSLLMALGTPIDAILYFGLPGFSQTGSPARVLVLWALCWAVLGALGLDIILKKSAPGQRASLATATAFALILAACLSLISSALATTLPGFKPLVPTLGEAFSRITEDWIRLALFSILSLAMIHSQVQRRLVATTPARFPILGSVALATLILDLFLAGMRINPSASPETIYPITPGITYLQQNLGHERVFPVNMYWSLYSAPHAVLPPNAATVFGLRDVQGYDSLMPGAYKKWANEFALTDARAASTGRRDSSPVEVANILFFQDPNSARLPETAARFVITPAADGWNPPQGSAPQGERASVTDEGMDIYGAPGSAARASLIAETGRSVGDLRWIEDGVTRVKLESNSTDASSLVLRDQMYAGWRAYVDEAPTAIKTSPDNPLQRIVSIPAGRHTVRFQFEPASFQAGLFAALISLTIFAGTSIYFLTCTFIGRRRLT